MTSTQHTLRLGRPLWIRHLTGRTQRYPSLSANHETSVAIVGGGMTGALLAHAFASAGVATTVLEAGLVGRGSTAASSALLLQEPDVELLQLEERYGRRTSRRIWRVSHESVRQLIALLRRLRIDCDLSKRTTRTGIPASGGCPRTGPESMDSTSSGQCFREVVV